MGRDSGPRWRVLISRLPSFLGYFDPLVIVQLKHLVTSVATKVDFCPLAGAKPLAYQNSKPLAKGKPLVSRPDLWLAGRTFG